MTNPAFPNRLTYRQIAIALLIVLLAYALRVTVIVQRARVDEQFLPYSGSDPYTYVRRAHEVLAGTFPTQPFFHHPGPPFFFAAVFKWLGDSVAVLYLTIALLDALTAGWLIGCGWLLTRRAWGGYLAGLLYAVYSRAIFYGTTALLAPQAMALFSPLIFLTLWQRERLSWGRTILIGILAGLMTLFRVNFLPFVGLSALWIVACAFFDDRGRAPLSSNLFVALRERVRSTAWLTVIGHGVLLAVFTAAMIAPVTLHNYRTSKGQFIPVLKIGSMQMYWANNRDSGGQNDIVPAIETLDMGYHAALERDIELAPLRYVTLLGYKLALFWNHLDVPNNANFYRGQAAVPLILGLPMNFSVLAVTGLLGLAALWYDDKVAFFYFGTMGGWMVFTFVMVWIYGRLRHPASIPLILLSAYLAVRIEAGLRHGIQWRMMTRRYSLPLVGIIALLLFSNWVLYPLPKLPIKRTYTQLPADAYPLNVRFDDVLLVGWRPIPQYWPAATDGYVPLFESYIVELFWEVPQPTDTVYDFYIAYILDEERYTGVDRPIGAVSFPHHTTNLWQPGTVYGEIVGFNVSRDVPEERSGQVRIGVWYAAENGSIVNVQTDNHQGFFVLDSLAVFNVLRPPEPPDLPPSDLVFGDMIALRGYALPDKAAPGETITLKVYWEALRDVPADYTLFLHVTDENDQIITQGDTLPVPQLMTDNWAPRYPLYGELPLTLPAVPGRYRVYAGLYNESGRLAVDAPDNRVLLGTVQVQ